MNLDKFKQILGNQQDIFYEWLFVRIPFEYLENQLIIINRYSFDFDFIFINSNLKLPIAFYLSSIFFDKYSDKFNFENKYSYQFNYLGRIERTTFEKYIDKFNWKLICKYKKDLTPRHII